MFIKTRLVESYYLQGVSYDYGGKYDYVRAFIDYILKDKTLDKKFEIIYLKEKCFKTAIK